MMSNTTVSSLIDIDRLLCDRISSISVPAGELQRTLDTVNPLLKRELEFRVRVIHEGVGNAVRLQFKNSIYNRIVPRTNIEVESLELIKYNRLAGPSSTYSSKGWKFNRRKRVKLSEEFDSEINALEDVHTIETDLQHLFYTIQYHLRNTLKDDIPYTFAIGTRYWSNWTAEFSTTAIPDSDEFNVQKPNLSLFDFALLKEKKSWTNILAFVEHTTSDLSENRGLAVYWGTAIKAYLIMREQPWRQFVLAYSNCANMLCTHYFDRSGVAVLSFCNRFYRRLLLSPCGEPLSQFSSRMELIMAFRHFVIAHHAMIERRVLHGDLSPNNFVIHKGIGYFIGFDHAEILAVNTTGTCSPGAGTMPYISIRILRSMMRMTLNINTNMDNNDPNKDVTPANAVQRLIKHRPSDDLESLFYIFVEFVAKYGGAHGELAPSWTQGSLPHMSALNRTLSACHCVKVGAVLDPTFMTETTSDYFAEFRPLVQHWQALVRLANNRDEKERVETTHDKVLEVLTTFIDNYAEGAPTNPSARSNDIDHPSIPEGLRGTAVV